MTTATPLRPAPPAPAAPPARRSPGRLRRLVQGPSGDPTWSRPALLGLLAVTAALYLWDLGGNGWANEYYAAAAQAGSVSWKAWFFGSLDAGNAITVDKTPASLWVMGLSIRLFGLDSWALLVPQALMGVATVALVVAAVRRTVGRPAPALLAGAVTALTPVAAVMFRFDNPDALLVLLLTAAGYAVVRALEGPRGGRWLVLAGGLVGTAFLAKMMQAFLVVPGFALAYLLLAPTGLGRRLLHLLGAGLALVVGGGWWVAAVALFPASARPYVGGSTNDSVLELALGYNGIQRLAGGEAGPRAGTPGLLRLFGAELGGQAAWLLPAALLALVAGLVATARAPRTDRTRAGLVVWGGWLLVTAAVFSFMAGTFHSYYTVALAPAVGALVGIGVGVLWPRRTSPAAAGALSAGVLVTALWSFVLLARSADSLPWLRWVVLAAGLLAALGLVAIGTSGTTGRRLVASLALLAALAGPAAYTLDTVTSTQTGSSPSAGPAVAGTTGGSGGGSRGFDGGTPPSGGAAPAGGGGGPQGTASSALTQLLEQDAGSYTWVAATTGAQGAAGYQLATGDAVMAIGGFSGNDSSPTLAEFQADVAAGEIHYYVAGGGTGGGLGGGRGGGTGGGSGTASQIAQWVAANYTAQTVDGVTVYDLSS